MKKETTEKSSVVEDKCGTAGSVPEHCLRNMGLRTSRQFKSKKRKQLKDVIKAMDSFNTGCAYVPGYDDEISKINDSLRSLRRKVSVTSWGR